MKTLIHQYKLIEDSRGAMFDYLDSIPFKKLHQPVELHDAKSVCYGLQHVVDNYLHWINGFALKIPVMHADATAWQSLDEAMAFFKEADKAVVNFLAKYPEDHQKITGYFELNDKNLTVTVLQLFTHVIAHECQQKGLILNMTRQLGYTPTDTDVIRF